MKHERKLKEERKKEQRRQNDIRRKAISALVDLSLRCYYFL